VTDAGQRIERGDFAHFLEIPTRWNDNDVYGHVNNVEYYAFFDTVINHWLIKEGGLDIHARGAGQAVGLCVESHCAYRAAIEFPDVVEAGLRVGKLGNSSVRYEIGIFSADEDTASADGWFVHVFVDAESREPVPIPETIRASLRRLETGGDAP
jgi:acyl-CoA thioester hydrolase